jgi:hypothetical protein
VADLRSAQPELKPVITSTVGFISVSRTSLLEAGLPLAGLRRYTLRNMLWIPVQLCATISEVASQECTGLLVMGLGAANGGQGWQIKACTGLLVPCSEPKANTLPLPFAGQPDSESACQN